MRTWPLARLVPHDYRFHDEPDTNGQPNHSAWKGSCDEFRYLLTNPRRLEMNRVAWIAMRPDRWLTA